MPITASPRLPPRLTPRPRILARLDADTPLVVLHAPSGYGKTAALTQWAAETSRGGIWLRVAAGEGEPAAFVQALALELADAGMLEPDNPLHTARESLVGGDPFALLKRGLRRIAGAMTLVLDEAENLDDESVAGILRLIAEHAPLSVRVGTRRASAFTEPGLSLALETDVVGTAELALSPDEAAAIMASEGSDPAVSYVLEHGASAALARIVLLAGDDSAPGDGTDGVEAAVESLLRLRAPAWGADFVRFLGVVSLSEIVDATLVAELSGRTDAAALLDRAEREGLGYWRTPPAPGDRDTALFVTSPVFRRILADASRRRLPAGRLRDAERRIARWHLAAGRAFPALQAAVAAGDGDLMTDIVRLHWYDLLRSGAEVRELFRGVPALTLRSRPLPSMLLAILWNAHGAHRLRALEYFALATYGARTQRAAATPADRALLSAIESAAHRVSGRTEQAVRSATVARDAMAQMSADERMRLGRNTATVYNQIGLSLLYGGRGDDAIESFRLSDASGRELGLLAGLQGVSQLAGTLALRGDIPAARASIDAARAARWPDGWRDGYAGSMLRLAEALVALEDADPDAAAAALAPLAPHRSTIEHAGILEYVDTVIDLLRGRADAAATRLDRVAAEQQRRGRLGGLGGEKIRAARVLVALGRGDLPEADRQATKLPAGPAREVVRGRIRLAAGDPVGALRILTAASPASLDPRTQVERLALSASALALSEPGEQDPLADALAHLSAAIAETGLWLPLALVPEAALAALAHEPAPDLVDAIRRAQTWAFIRSPRTAASLTQRERAVATALLTHTTVAEIAAALSVSPNTVKSQLRAVYRKLGVRTRDDAVRALAARPEGER